MSLRSNALSDSAVTTTSASPTASLRWFILFGVWLVYFTFGLTAMSLAPLVEPITRDLGIGHGTMGLIFGVWQLTFIASGVPCGMLLDRLGPRRALFLGIATVALSSLLRSVAPDYVAFALAGAKALAVDPDPERIAELRSRAAGAEVRVESDDNVHFAAIVVASQFAGLRAIARHQRVYQTLGDLMGREIHALSIEALTPEERTQRGG